MAGTMAVVGLPAAFVESFGPGLFTVMLVPTGWVVVVSDAFDFGEGDGVVASASPVVSPAVLLLPGLAH